MLVGVAVIVISFLFKSILELIKVQPIIATIAGIILIAAGFFFLSSGQTKQASEEVPIYQGTGKNRKIVGYRREK